MKIMFGKRSSKTVAEILLKDPGYILWCLKQPATDPMSAV
jgi:hypothetical protein